MSYVVIDMWSVYVCLQVLVLGPQVLKKSIMYDHVKSINLVTVKNVLLTNVRYYLLIYVTQCCP